MTHRGAPPTPPADAASSTSRCSSIRVFETEAERQYKAARIGGYCHLSSGQEATTVGAVARAAATTTCSSPATAATASRSRAASPPEAVMAELFGRARRLRARARRLDAPARRRRAASTAAGASSPASCRSRPASRSRSSASGKHAGGPLRARRRRREHGRLARVAEPRRAVGPAGRLPRRQQRLRDGHRASTRASAEPELYKRAAALTACTASASTATTSRPSLEASDRLLRARARASASPRCSRR